MVKIPDPLGGGLLGYGFFTVADDGTISGKVPDTYSLGGYQSYKKIEMRLEGVESGAVYAEAPIWLAYREVWITPETHFKPRQTVTFHISGFKSGRPLYAH